MNLDDDVAAAVQRLRRERDLGLSEALNELARRGLAGGRQRSEFRQETDDMGRGIDYTNVGDALETLDGPASP